MSTGSAGRSCAAAHYLASRSAELLDGSVALNLRMSPPLTSVMLVRRTPHSVKLHGFAVDVLVVVLFSQI